ncbi:MAG: hypothetical protein HUJ71_06720 [Pseudobutyrivibrio sp.]|nr:hypothetical protein [Pseudobutyrivibrio sp.]
MLLLTLGHMTRGFCECNVHIVCESMRSIFKDQFSDYASINIKYDIEPITLGKNLSKRFTKNT